MNEKQIQQNYRPLIAVHKWFARRPGTLFRGLLLSEFVPGALPDTFYRAHHLQGKRIADPFMGGGTPLLEANRLGCDIVGFDINPMAYWIVRQEIGALDVAAYREAAEQLRTSLTAEIGSLYQTTCLSCGSHTAHVKYFIWVKVISCQQCEHQIDLFPGYLLAENRRHPQNVIICAHCGDLNQVDNRDKPGACSHCREPLCLKGPANRNRCLCPNCRARNVYPNSAKGAPAHRMIAIEYHCSECKPQHRGRFFKKPDQNDLAKYAAIEHRLSQLPYHWTPTDEIPAGDETNRLHKWGYHHYAELFNRRQLLGLELSAEYITHLPEGCVRDALATNFSDLLRYQNMLCRYDTMALKSLDIFSVHGFPVGLIQCESNFLGIPNGQAGANVGSGGWSNVIEKYARAKEYCAAPFEMLHKNGHKVRMPIKGEWIGERSSRSDGDETRLVELACASSTRVALPPASLDAVVTDPPYFANVQYAELMDFCYVWLRRLVDDHHGYFLRRSTRNADELTGNVTLARGLEHFTEGLANVFGNMARALKPGSPLIFTYHHNTLEAYFPVAVSILDAGLTCSSALPCPAEMGGSIHINGTGSSVVDTVFICRSTGTTRKDTLATDPQQIAGLVMKDIEALQIGKLKPTQGDIRCVAFGHLIRLAIWSLRQTWDKTLPVTDKLKQISQAVTRLGGWPGVRLCLSGVFAQSSKVQTWAVMEAPAQYEVAGDDISF